MGVDKMVGSEFIFSRGINGYVFLFIYGIVVGFVIL